MGETNVGRPKKTTALLRQFVECLEYVTWKRTTNIRLAVIAGNHILIYKYKLSQRDRVAGWVSYGQKWKTGTRIQYFTDIIGLSSTAVT